MKFKDFTPGMTVWAVGSRKMGNTTIKTTFTDAIRIVSVDTSNESVQAEIGNDMPRKFTARTFAKWKKEKPLLVKVGLRHRLATREEVAADKAQREQRAATAASNLLPDPETPHDASQGKVL